MIKKSILTWLACPSCRSLSLVLYAVNADVILCNFVYAKTNSTWLYSFADQKVIGAGSGDARAFRPLEECVSTPENEIAAVHIPSLQTPGTAQNNTTVLDTRSRPILLLPDNSRQTTKDDNPESSIQSGSAHSRTASYDSIPDSPFSCTRLLPESRLIPFPDSGYVPSDESFQVPLSKPGETVSCAFVCDDESQEPAISVFPLRAQRQEGAKSVLGSSTAKSSSTGSAHSRLSPSKPERRIAPFASDARSSQQLAKGKQQPPRSSVLSPKAMGSQPQASPAAKRPVLQGYSDRWLKNLQSLTPSTESTASTVTNASKPARNIPTRVQPKHSIVDYVSPYRMNLTKPKQSKIVSEGKVSTPLASNSTNPTAQSLRGTQTVAPPIRKPVVKASNNIRTPINLSTASRSSDKPLSQPQQKRSIKPSTTFRVHAEASSLSPRKAPEPALPLSKTNLYLQANQTLTSTQSRIRPGTQPVRKPALSLLQPTKPKPPTRSIMTGKPITIRPQQEATSQNAASMLPKREVTSPVPVIKVDAAVRDLFSLNQVGYLDRPGAPENDEDMVAQGSHSIKNAAIECEGARISSITSSPEGSMRAGEDNNTHASLPRSWNEGHREGSAQIDSAERQPILLHVAGDKVDEFASLSARNPDTAADAGHAISLNQKPKASPNVTSHGSSFNALADAAPQHSIYLASTQPHSTLSREGTHLAEDVAVVEGLSIKPSFMLQPCSFSTNVPGGIPHNQLSECRQHSSLQPSLPSLEVMHTRNDCWDHNVSHANALECGSKVPEISSDLPGFMDQDKDLECIIKQSNGNESMLGDVRYLLTTLRQSLDCSDASDNLSLPSSGRVSFDSTLSDDMQPSTSQPAVVWSEMNQSSTFFIASPASGNSFCRGMFRSLSNDGTLDGSRQQGIQPSSNTTTNRSLQDLDSEDGNKRRQPSFVDPQTLEEVRVSDMSQHRYQDGTCAHAPAIDTSPQVQPQTANVTHVADVQVEDIKHHDAVVTVEGTTDIGGHYNPMYGQMHDTSVLEWPANQRSRFPANPFYSSDVTSSVALRQLPPFNAYGFERDSLDCKNEQSVWTGASRVKRGSAKYATSNVRDSATSAIPVVLEEVVDDTEQHLEATDSVSSRTSNLEEPHQPLPPSNLHFMHSLSLSPRTNGGNYPDVSIHHQPTACAWPVQEQSRFPENPFYGSDLASSVAVQQFHPFNAFGLERSSLDIKSGQAVRSFAVSSAAQSSAKYDVRASANSAIPVILEEGDGFEPHQERLHSPEINATARTYAAESTVGKIQNTAAPFLHQDGAVPDAGIPPLDDQPGFSDVRCSRARPKNTASGNASQSVSCTGIDIHSLQGTADPADMTERQPMFAINPSFSSDLGSSIVLRQLAPFNTQGLEPSIDTLQRYSQSYTHINAASDTSSEHDRTFRGMERGTECGYPPHKSGDDVSQHLNQISRSSSCRESVMSESGSSASSILAREDLIRISAALARNRDRVLNALARLQVSFSF